MEERKQKERSTRRAIVEAGEEILRQLQPIQKKRLQEICLQAQGGEALFKPEMIQALGLSATQQIKLANLRQEAERQISALYQPHVSARQAPPPIDLGAVAERTMSIQRDSENRMINVLTVAQQNRLKEMRGKEFAGVARFTPANVNATGDGGGLTSVTQSNPR